MAISALARKVFFSFAGSEARYGAQWLTNIIKPQQFQTTI
jgi:hypothetical protein